MKDKPMSPEVQRERYCEAIRGGRLYRILANDPRYRPLDVYVKDFAQYRWTDPRND